LGTAYRGIKKHHDSLNCLKKALDISRTSHAQNKEGEALYQLGITYGELEDFEQSLTSLQKSLRIFQTLGSRANVARTLLELAKFSLKINSVSPETLQSYLNQAELICLELQLPFLSEVQQLKIKWLKNQS
jgi:tetratricopeptide (TPR) repeat protein